MTTHLRERRFERGEVVAPQVVYDLGRDWYATRMTRDWVRPDAAEAAGIFRRHGLVGGFWSLEAP